MLKQTLTIYANIPLEIDGLPLGWTERKTTVTNEGNGWHYGTKLYRCDHLAFLELLEENGWDLTSVSLTTSTPGKRVTYKIMGG